MLSRSASAAAGQLPYADRHGNWRTSAQRSPASGKRDGRTPGGRSPGRKASTLQLAGYERGGQVGEILDLAA